MGKIVVALVAVYTVIDCDIANIALGKETLGVIADFQIIAPHAGHILDDNRLNCSSFRKAYHLIPAGAVESTPETPSSIKNVGFGKPLSCAYLSRIFF